MFLYQRLQVDQLLDERNNKRAEKKESDIKQYKKIQNQFDQIYFNEVSEEEML